LFAGGGDPAAAPPPPRRQRVIASRFRSGAEKEKVDNGAASV